MKKISQLIFFLLPSLMASGQDLQGQWSGALNVQGTQLRIVFHVNHTNKEYTATIDSPDQRVKDIPVTAISFNIPDVKFESSAIGMIYEGVLSGKRITGTWKQAGQEFPLAVSKEDIPKK